MIIQESEESSLSRSFRSVSAMNTCASFFCSSVSTFGTIFEHTFRLFNSCYKIEWTLDLLMLVLVTTSLTILRQSWLINFFTCSCKMMLSLSHTSTKLWVEVELRICQIRICFEIPLTTAKQCKLRFVFVTDLLGVYMLAMFPKLYFVHKSGYV